MVTLNLNVLIPISHNGRLSEHSSGMEAIRHNSIHQRDIRVPTPALGSPVAARVGEPPLSPTFECASILSCSAEPRASVET